MSVTCSKREREIEGGCELYIYAGMGREGREGREGRIEGHGVNMVTS